MPKLATAFRTTAVSVSPATRRLDAIVPTDGELLMQFVRQRDQRAFAQIVERHGRLVWMICRQVLGHHQDVEDAFQATFLILAQRASTIRASDSASAWLYKVSMRTALAARRKRSRRREEPLAIEPGTDESRSVIDDRELLYILVQELRMLPARYQTPLVMRYLEGQSRRTIADQTDSTVAQVQGRLVRGRRMLRSRFLRRGVSLSMAAGAVSGTNESASAAVTPALVAQTAENCLAMKTSGDAGGISPLALSLFYDGVKAMWFTFVGKCTAVVSAIALAGSILLAAQGESGRNSAAEAAAARIELQNALQTTAAGAVENGPDSKEAAALVGRFKYKVPIETGQSEFKEGGRIEIQEVWGTRPKIEVGGQYLVKGKYVLPPGQRGTLYFYETTDGSWGREPTASVDLQTVTFDKPEGEFTLLHGMQGPGYFHLYLASPEKYSHYFANVYFGTGDNVLKDDSSSNKSAANASSGSTKESPTTQQPAVSAEKQREATRLTLQRRYEDLFGEMCDHLDEKAAKSAELEMQQLQKSLLQRRLERLHAMLIEIESPTVSAAASEKAQDRNKLHDEVTRNMEVARNELAEQTAKTAKLSANLERLQLAAARIQSRLDELNRRCIQLELP